MPVTGMPDAGASWGYRLPELVSGILVRRYKRFLADVRLDTGEAVTAHCPNSGSMKGCANPGSRVFLSRSTRPERKYPYTWELTEVPGTLVGINTLVPNRLVRLAVETDRIPELSGYDRLTAEIRTGAHTRLDLLLEKAKEPENSQGRKLFVEIKNCTLVEAGWAMFPDAVTLRGQKHLEALEALCSLGHRAMIFFLVQRMDAEQFRPADHIDPEYGRKLRKAVRMGVEALVMDTCITPRLIRINRSLPSVLD